MKGIMLEFKEKVSIIRHGERLSIKGKYEGDRSDLKCHNLIRCSKFNKGQHNNR